MSVCLCVCDGKGKESLSSYLVQDDYGLATHVLEQQHGDLQMLHTAGAVQYCVASLSAEEQ